MWKCGRSLASYYHQWLYHIFIVQHFRGNIVKQHGHNMYLVGMWVNLLPTTWKTIVAVAHRHLYYEGMWLCHFPQNFSLMWFVVIRPNHYFLVAVQVAKLQHLWTIFVTLWSNLMPSLLCLWHCDQTSYSHFVSSNFSLLGHVTTSHNPFFAVSDL